MSSTTVPDVKEGLVDLLRGVQELSGVDIRYAESAERRRDAIWLGDTSISEVSLAGMRGGRSRRHESFTVEINVEAKGLKAVDAERAAYDRARAVEQAIADDPKLGNIQNLSWMTVEQFESATTEIGDGAYCLIQLTVRCQGSFL